jgi:hypothetical protein
MGTIHKTYQLGAVYCHNIPAGAHAVYGNIWLKFQATPNYGYSITDETGATDNAETPSATTSFRSRTPATGLPRTARISFTATSTSGGSWSGT